MLEPDEQSQVGFDQDVFIIPSEFTVLQYQGKISHLTQNRFLPDKQRCLCFPSCTLERRIQSG